MINSNFHELAYLIFFVELCCHNDYILNKSENATLQYFILFEKILEKKYLLKLNNVS